MREMKDSGVEWIGEIPKDWEVVQTKFLFKIGRGRVIGKDELIENGKYPVYSSQTKNNGCLGFINTYDFNSEQLTWTTDGANAGTIFKREGKYNCTNVCGTLELVKNNQWLQYQKYALEYIVFFHKREDTNGFKIMNNEMANIKTICPTFAIQQKIADYLDQKCEKIDSTIKKQEILIEKLKEYKQSLITETVTKGLNPNVKMKDSGVEWIGEVPNHWKICRLRNLGNVQNGISKSGEYFGHGEPFVSYGDVYKNYKLPVKVTGLIDSTEDEKKNYSVEKGDVFFTRTSEVINEIGISSVCEKTIKNATFAGFLIRFRPIYEIINIKYSMYYFRSEHQRTYFTKQMNLVTRASLSQDLLKSMLVLLPTEKEQQEIADYLDKKCESIDKAIEQKQKVIEKLTEYKKSLIYEVVTGKKEV